MSSNMYNMSTFLALARDVDKLDADKPEGWSTWKSEALQTVLAADGVSIHIVDGTTARPTKAEDAATWDQLNTQAESILRNMSHPNCRDLHANAVGGCAVFAALVAHFKKSSFGTHSSARATFHRVVHDTSKPISIYVQAITAAAKRLQSLLPEKEVLAESYIKDVLLQNLDKSFGSTRSTLLAQPGGEPDLKTCKEVLNAAVPDNFDADEEAENQEERQSASIALTARVRRSGYAGKGRDREGARGSGGAGYGSASRGGGYGGDDRGRGGDDRGRGGGHGDGQGFTDSRGNRWGDMSMDGCHRCGGMSHKAACCVKDMPQEVKDWCLNRTYNTAHIAHDSTHFAQDKVYFQADAMDAYDSDNDGFATDFSG
ncbi:hypothetical protein CPB85DRAFT_1330587 [Mucidula mucida]|nr:hypothetical protein CPB85DRAFT_1330587 [Mucidula mucida]